MPTAATSCFYSVVYALLLLWNQEIKSEIGEMTNDDPYAEVPVPRGPIEQERAEAWEQYALSVSSKSQKLIKSGGPDPCKWSKPATTDGSLVVIGSGIKCVGQFSVEALEHLQSADHVFYHVADPVTENYILKIKPQAKDLSVLYANKKERFLTYIQMAEAMIHPVRQGQKVVTIFYGHPGIFVYASHRAIRIAHKQGLRAKMIPGVSAIDCLVADIGVDPSYPGLQMYEATDLVIRKRRILTDGHVVIFQVGCVGDKGYRRQGYLMQHFHVLIEHLQSIYGADYKVTHYVASQFPSVRPIIQNIPLSSLLDSDFAKKTIKGVSTFYIAPKDTRETDPEMARKLGLSPQGVQLQQRTPVKPKTTKRDIYKYGQREQTSLTMLSNWKVPGAYEFTHPTAAANLMISLAHDSTKTDEFIQNPTKVLKETAGITPLQTSYLASGNRSLMRLAVKPDSSKAARDAAIALLTNGSFGKSYADEARKYAHDPNADKLLTSFLTLHGFPTTPDAVSEALQSLRESSLLPWRQIYRNKLGTLVIHCKEADDNGQVIWNDAPIQSFSFQSSTLSWKADDGLNQSSATLHFTLQDNLPLCKGKLWKKGEKEPSNENYVGIVENFVSPLSVWRGKYRTVKLTDESKTKPGPELSINFSSANPSGTVEFGGTPVVNFNYNNRTLSWQNGEITFFTTKATASDPPVEKFYGYTWVQGQSKPEKVDTWGTKDETFLKPWSGKYKTYIGPKGKGKPAQELVISGGLTESESSIQFGTSVIKFHFDNPILIWLGEKESDYSAEIHMEVFTNGVPGFKGKIWKGNEPKPSEINFEGSADEIYLNAWLGCYYTKVLQASGKAKGGQPFSITKQANDKDFLIAYNGEEISNWNYSGAKRQLVWSESHNSTNGNIQFYIPTPEKGTGLRFFGKIWAKNAAAPGKTNFWGSTVPFPLAKGGATSWQHQLEQILENIAIIVLIELLKFAWKKFKKWWKAKKDGEPKDEQEKLEKESKEADDQVQDQEKEVKDEASKTDELEPEPDPSPEPPTPPDPPPDPPTNEVVDTDTETSDVDTDTDVDTDVDVDVDVDVEIIVCSLM